MSLKKRITQLKNDISDLSKSEQKPFVSNMCILLGHKSIYEIRFTTENGSIRNLHYKESGEFITDNVEIMRDLAKTDAGLQRVLNLCNS